MITKGMLQALLAYEIALTFFEVVEDFEQAASDYLVDRASADPSLPLH